MIGQTRAHHLVRFLVQGDDLAAAAYGLNTMYPHLADSAAASASPSAASPRSPLDAAFAARRSSSGSDGGGGHQPASPAVTAAFDAAYGAAGLSSADVDAIESHMLQLAARSLTGQPAAGQLQPSLEGLLQRSSMQVRHSVARTHSQPRVLRCCCSSVLAASCAGHGGGTPGLAMCAPG
jgi:hypothetical protein